MGNTLDNTPIKIKNAYNPSLNGWQIIQKKDFYNIWKNNATQQQIQQYFYNAVDSNDYKKVKELFAFRFEREFLVNSKYIKQVPSKQMCSTQYGASIFTERIAKRLSSLNKIKFPSILHVYHASLRGFNELYERIGYFPVSEQMIGLDSLKRIKVWVSPNFGSQTPEFGSRYKAQKDLVKEIVNLIASYTQNSEQREQIDLFLDKGTSFQQTLHLLYDYASQYNAQIPSYVDDTNNYIDNQLEMLEGISQNLEVFSKQKKKVTLEKPQQIDLKPTKQKSTGSGSYKLNNLPIKYDNPKNTAGGKKNLQSQYFDKNMINKEPQRTTNKLMNQNNTRQQYNIQKRQANSASHNIIYKPQNQVLRNQIEKLKNNNKMNNNNNFRVSSISEVPNYYNQRVSTFNPQRAGIKESPSQIVIIKNPGQLNMHLNNQNQYSFSNKSDIYQPRKSALILRSDSNQLSSSRLIENRMKAAQMKNQLNQQTYSRLREQNQVAIKNEYFNKSDQNQLSRSRLIQNRMKAKQMAQQSNNIQIKKQKNNNPQYQNQKIKNHPYYQQKAMNNQISKPAQQVVSRIEKRHVLLDEQPRMTVNTPQNNGNYNQKQNRNYERPVQRANYQQERINYKKQANVARSPDQKQTIPYNNSTSDNKNQTREQKRKNMVAQQAKVSKKREYIYQFDLHADESSSDDESKHIKIIINSQAKNKNKNIKVQKTKS